MAINENVKDTAHPTDQQTAAKPVALWDSKLEQLVNFDPSDVERALSGEPGRYSREEPTK